MSAFPSVRDDVRALLAVKLDVVGREQTLLAVVPAMPPVLVRERLQNS